MLLETAHLADKPPTLQAPHASRLVNGPQSPQTLPESTLQVCLLQLEAQDTLPDLLTVLRQQDQPVAVLLPLTGEALSQPEHFRELRHWHRTATSSPPLCLVIPAQRPLAAKLAMQYDLAHTASLEEALHMLVQTPAPSSFPALSAESKTMPASQRPGAGHRRRAEAEPLQTALPPPSSSPLPATSHPARQLQTPQTQQPSLRKGVILLVVLLVASGILLPLLLTPSPLPPRAPGTTASSFGTLAFTTSGQYNPAATEGYNDIITLSLPHLPAPPAGMRYRAWLLPDVGDDTTMPLLLGTFAGGSVELTYADERHRNLLATYSGVRITVEPEAKTPKVSPELPSQNPATWRWEGFIANLPTPGDPAHASFLSHVRHLLAREPTLQANQMPGGLALWLTRNVAKLAEWASAAQGTWQGAQTSEGEAAQIHRHLLRILEYVDGLFYYTRDVPAGSPWLVDRVAGKIGLLNSVPDQNPPALLTHVALHLTGLTSSPGHTEQQKQLVLLMEKVIEQMQTDMQQVRQDAVALVKKTPQQLQQPESRTTLNHLVLLTSRLTSGWLDTASGNNLGGVVWMSSRLQQLATIALVPSKPA